MNTATKLAFYGALIFLMASIAGFAIFFSTNENFQPEASKTGDTEYESLEELNDACNSYVGVPDGATDVAYSSTSLNSRAVARIDFAYDGCNCWFMQKITLYKKNFTGTEIEATSTSDYESDDGKTWSLEWNDTQGMALLYDGSDGWLMNVLYVEGDGVSEQVLQELADDVIVIEEDE